MSVKPRILISRHSKFDGKAYADAVRAAGGEPIVEYGYTGDEMFDGLLLAGGEDIDPSYYGEENNGSNPPDLNRDKTEWALCEKYVNAGKPIFAICRGCQILNVYLGGTLIQHIHTAADHSTGDTHSSHVVVNVEGSIHHKLLGDEFRTTTSHHQAIKVPGKSVRITQYSKNDGIIEGFEHETLPIFAVQWHPERLCCEERREGEPSAQPLFDHFIGLCKEQMK